jgi:hopanoid biosynthesis associated RND transporter like protein HpnN
MTRLTSFAWLFALWRRVVLDRPWLVLAASAALSVAAFKYTYDNLRIDTNTQALISNEVAYQRDRIRLEERFPQDVNRLWFLVEGVTAEQTARAVDALSAALRAEPQRFENVTVPDGGAFFARHALLYREVDELRALRADLQGARPLLAMLAADPTAGGFMALLARAVSAPPGQMPAALAPVLAEMREPVAAAARGESVGLSWEGLLLPPDAEREARRRFVAATPVLDFTKLHPAEDAVAALHRIVAQVERDGGAGLKVRVTGETLLEHEELKSVTDGTTWAGIWSFVLVCATLLFAFRSAKLMLATFATLAMGLLLSMAFATLAIGHLNLISIAFAVLFIGMGDAFSSHFCLRYRELVKRGLQQREALAETARSTGPSLALCMLTAAIGLYAFIPTSYAGVSELGIIAGTSMMIAFATTFTTLPALLRVAPLRPVSTWRRSNFGPPPAILRDWPITYAGVIRFVAIALALFALALLPKVEIDFNPVNLRDQSTSSVQTFRYLLADKETSPLTLSALAASPEEARAKAARFAALPEVDRVTTLFDLVPEMQGEKLKLIAGAREALGTVPDTLPGPPPRASLAALDGALDGALREKRIAADREGAAGLREALRAYLAAYDAAAPAEREALGRRLQANLFGTLPATVERLKTGLQARAVDVETLPADLREQWLAKDGTYRVQIHARGDLNDLDTLRQFVRAAQAVDPRVTGLPVIYVESMGEVVKAFVQAFSIALVAAAMILLAVLRSWRDTALVLLPLLLASLLTAAATALLGIPLNFANIITLPLLFGLGIDSGIHMAHRLHYLHHSADDIALFSSSEAQGVVYGTLTTIFSFASLAFISHEGTASMGQLLAIGLFFTLACALVVLPAFSPLALKGQRK